MENSPYVELGIRLKEARMAKGFTQSEVANLLGYSSAQFISNAERGLCRLPFVAISRLVRMYEMDPESIIKILIKAHENHLRRALKGTAPKSARKSKR